MWSWCKQGGRWLALTPFLLVLGCGRLGFESLASDDAGGGLDDADDGLVDAGEGAADSGGSDGTESCALGPFSAPTEVFQSPSRDYGPTLSRDGLTLFLSGDHPGGLGATDIWMATRANLDSSFSALTNVGVLNTDSDDAEPALSGDDLTLYFESNRGGTFELWSSSRSDPGAAFSAPERVEAADWSVVGDARGPSITADGLELVFASDEGGATGLWRVTRTISEEPFGVPSEIVELRSNDIWGYPGISPDGLELYYVRTTAQLEIFVARRPDRASPFSAPQLVEQFDSAGRDSDPELSADGRRIVFTSNRFGADYGVWLATRDCVP